MKPMILALALLSSTALAAEPGAGANRETVLAAMLGKVIAKGELVGTYAQRALPPQK